MRIALTIAVVTMLMTLTNTAVAQEPEPPLEWTTPETARLTSAGMDHQPGVAPIVVSNVPGGLVQPTVLDPEELELDTLGLVPHRSEFADVFRDDDGNPQQRAWRYTQLTHAHNWYAHDIVIRDTNFSWNGTGTDEIVADGKTLTLLTRIMPFSIPAGVLVSSHYGEQVTASFARPDGEVTFESVAEGTFIGLDPTVPSEDRPPRRLANRRVYGYSLWPYLFALMDLEPGDSFVLPGYELSNDQEYYVRAVVHGTTVVTDERQRRFSALVVRRFVTPTLEEAILLDPEAQTVWSNTTYPMRHRITWVIAAVGSTRPGSSWSVARASSSTSRNSPYHRDVGSKRCSRSGAVYSRVPASRRGGTTPMTCTTVESEVEFLREHLFWLYCGRSVDCSSPTERGRSGSTGQDGQAPVDATHAKG